MLAIEQWKILYFLFLGIFLSLIPVLCLDICFMADYLGQKVIRDPLGLSVLDDVLSV